MNMDSVLELRKVRLERAGFEVLNDIDLAIQPGEFVCLLGPTGCGKTTLLDIIAGLVAPTGGEVRHRGCAVNGINLHCSYLFQQDALLPWHTVLENAGLSLRLRQLPLAVADAQAMRWLERVGLAQASKAYPGQLSGGMRKRLALARILAHDAPLLLMDEPFAALDALTRQAMQTLLLELCEDRQTSVLFVTHDLDEALALADRIVMLSPGPSSRCQAHLTVDLPRPRRMPALRSHPEYQGLHQQLWQMLHPLHDLVEAGD